jgi:hypothetical protein
VADHYSLQPDQGDAGELHFTNSRPTVVGGGLNDASVSRCSLATTEDGTAKTPAVEDMTTEEQISKDQNERDEARQNLRETLTEVNKKVEGAGEDFHPDHLIESHPVGASLVAGALGFWLAQSSTLGTHRAFSAQEDSASFRLRCEFRINSNFSRSSSLSI